jgi:hypothetical protein
VTKKIGQNINNEFERINEAFIKRGNLKEKVFIHILQIMFNLNAL